jgi:hypothetical protein
MLLTVDINDVILVYAGGNPYLSNLERLSSNSITGGKLRRSLNNIPDLKLAIFHDKSPLLPYNLSREKSELACEAGNYAVN